MLKQKFSLGEMALFPMFWKKNWKKSGKKFSIKFFFFTKICFSELEKAYVQLFVLNFFCLGVRPQKKSQIPENCQKSIFVDQNQKKNSKPKVVHTLFLARKKKFSKKKKLKIFLQIFFNFFSKTWEKVPFPPTKIFVSTFSRLNLSF